ncbi:unnamed protein product [Vitrella brassicaformis CCMP3155]|uniref:Uncharacterized protein n=1 Tax=Vitrella brassicaformis (strain CCMP3155) TaxID=1169540 RepID=A0A0G4EW49_VITBC|nr:unnamed protein product [Vitrella brassicaformis CCMP3155]|eukprot:CEM02570.1 unnamed protein product [Vitrella brassicaformis CCMP3155]
MESTSLASEMGWDGGGGQAEGGRSIAAHHEVFNRARLLNVLKAEARELKTTSETRGRGLALFTVDNSLQRRATQYHVETHTPLSRSSVNGLISEAKHAVFPTGYFKDGIHKVRRHDLGGRLGLMVLVDFKYGGGGGGGGGDDEKKLVWLPEARSLDKDDDIIEMLTELITLTQEKPVKRALLAEIYPYTQSSHTRQEPGAVIEHARLRGYTKLGFVVPQPPPPSPPAQEPTDEEESTGEGDEWDSEGPSEASRSSGSEATLDTSRGRKQYDKSIGPIEVFPDIDEERRVVDGAWRKRRHMYVRVG